MSPRSPVARIAILVFALLCALPARAGEFVDTAGRHVPVPDHIGRVMAADPVAALFVFVLAPERLAGWPLPLSARERGYIPAKSARLPVTGLIAGPNPVAAAAAIRRWRPDLVLQVGPPSPAMIDYADAVEARTGTPVLLIDGSIQRIPEMLHKLAALLGIRHRGTELISAADHAIAALRGRLLIQSATDRPRVYYGKGPDGMTTGLGGSRAISDVEQAGAIDVADGSGTGGLRRITPAQLRAWNPDVIIAEYRSFANRLRRDPAWRGIKAVRDRRVYYAPADPFGWIDDPPGINRLIGLYWLSAVFYPGEHSDFSADVRDFYQTFYGWKLSDKQLAALVHSAEAKPNEFSQTTGGPALLAPGAALSPVPLGAAPAPNTGPPGRRQPRQQPNPLGPNSLEPLPNPEPNPLLPKP